MQGQSQTALYGKLEFWEKRYAENPKQFDWYQDYDGVKDIVTQFIKKESKILMVGCGNSAMSERMFMEGYSFIYNIDFSKKCIAAMEELYRDFGDTFQYKVMDVRNLQFEDESFDCVIDKGTLDTILSGEYSGLNSQKMLDQIYRVLAPKGIYICITYGSPEIRVSYFEKPEYEWTIGPSPYKIYKPKVDNSAPGAHIEEKPSEEYHYIYICKKGIVDPNANIRRMSQMKANAPGQNFPSFKMN